MKEREDHRKRGTDRKIEGVRNTRKDRKRETERGT